jgi:hypothetical protein
MCTYDRLNFTSHLNPNSHFFPSLFKQYVWGGPRGGGGGLGPPPPPLFFSQTALWLRHSIYLRLAPEILPGEDLDTYKKRKGAWSKYASLFTFVVSAFWHGFCKFFYLSSSSLFFITRFINILFSDPGFYLFFVSLHFIGSVAQLSRKLIRPYFLPTRPLASLKAVYDLCGILATSIAINYSTASFQLHTIEKSFKFWSRYYFFVHVGVVSILVLDALGVFKRLVLRVDEEKKRKKE